MADAEVKDMKTIIFFSTERDKHLKSIGVFAEAARADERCAHKIFMRPLMMNVFQFIRGVRTDNDADIIGCHEIIFCPDGPTRERLSRIKNIVHEKDCMFIVGDSDVKKKRVNELIEWLLEETEEIKL